MNSHYTYLIINIATIFFPLVLSFDKKVAFYKQWKHLWVGMLATGAFFIVWDVWFTRQGVWSFNEQYVMGYYIGGLPIEEWLFFITVPYACTFVYECLLHYFPFRTNRDWGWRMFLPLSVILIIIGMIFFRQAYTCTTFVFCGLGLLLVRQFHYRIGTIYADAFLTMFFINIIPFLIVNGFLTALPVVQYNHAENLDIRLYTIPIEDVFYGMLLMLGNVAGLEWSRRKHMHPARTQKQNTTA